MKNAQKIKNQEVSQGGTHTTKEVAQAASKIPTYDELKDWTKKDLRAAIAFLNMLAQNPELMDTIAQLIYDKAMQHEDDSRKLKTNA